MDDADIDHILSKQEQILPSSGFVSSVMDAVRSEATAPPPIPFPWKRALPMLALAAAALFTVLVVVIAGIAQGGPEPNAASLMLRNALSNGVGSLVGWTVLALLVAFISATLSMRLAGARS